MTQIDKTPIRSEITSINTYPQHHRSFLAYGFDLLCAGAGLSFIGALLTDYTYSMSPVMQWANFSAWLLIFGAAFATAAGFLGIMRFIFERPRGFLTARWLYLLSLLSVFILCMTNNFVHTRDAWTSVVPTGLELSAATVCAVILAAIFRAISPVTSYTRS